MHTKERFAELLPALLARKQLVATLYKDGVTIAGWPSSYPEKDPDRERPRRGIIRNQSLKSLRRAGFYFANSPSDWRVMITLTFRERHPYAAERFRHWCSVMPWSGEPSAEWGWVREYQDNGNVHYHVVLTESTLVSAFGGEPLQTERIRRKGKTTILIRGRHELWIVGRWVEAVGDDSPRFEAFQWGGIVELLRNVDSPGRYFGQYVAKASQKKLPAGDAPIGRWWWISPASKIVPRGTFPLWHYPFDVPLRYVFDFKRLLRNSDLEALPE